MGKLNRAQSSDRSPATIMKQQLDNEKKILQKLQTMSNKINKQDYKKHSKLLKKQSSKQNPMGNLKNIMKADIKRRTKEKANALTIKEKIMI